MRRFGWRSRPGARADADWLDLLLRRDDAAFSDALRGGNDGGLRPEYGTDESRDASYLDGR